jgi:hypothetical protein
MWWFSRAPGSADPLRRSLLHASVTDLIGSVSESLHRNVRAISRFLALEQRILVFSLEVAAVLIACAGAILAMFAWTGVAL